MSLNFGNELGSKTEHSTYKLSKSLNGKNSSFLTYTKERYLDYQFCKIEPKKKDKLDVKPFKLANRARSILKKGNSPKRSNTVKFKQSDLVIVKRVDSFRRFNKETPSEEDEDKQSCKCNCSIF